MFWLIWKILIYLQKGEAVKKSNFYLCFICAKTLYRKKYESLKGRVFKITEVYKERRKLSFISTGLLPNCHNSAFGLNYVIQSLKSISLISCCALQRPRGVVLKPYIVTGEALYSDWLDYLIPGVNLVVLVLFGVIVLHSISRDIKLAQPIFLQTFQCGFQ